MRRSALVKPYPWAALPALSRATLAASRQLGPIVTHALDVEKIAEAAADVIGVPLEVTARALVARDHAPAASGPRVAFELDDGSLGIAVSVEADLAALALSHVLGRPIELAAPDAPFDGALGGALAAVLAEIARRAGRAVPLVRSSAAPRTGPGMSVELAVRVDGRLFAAHAWVTGGAAPGVDGGPPVDLAQLGSLEIALPVVVARASATRDALATLGPGDAFMPGAGWTIERDGSGRAALAAPGAEHGIAVDLGRDGSIVLRDETVALGADDGDATTGEEPAVDGDMTTADDTGIDKVGDVALDAPVVVRVEIGSVSLAARDWARLRPGDVIETGRRIAEPVVLRVAGREVARGELVDVEGELGVRIREITGRDGG